MRYFKKICICMLAFMMLLGVSVPAYAHEVPQLDKRGSISVTMRMGSTIVGGGTLTLYRVGEVYENDGNYSFQPTGDFASCGESFENVSSPALARRLADYASDEKLSGVTQTIDADGKIKFSNLEVGLYLLVQNKAASGYNKAEPFLVSLPYMQKDGTYTYAVDASPKVEVDKPTPSTPPTTPPKPSEPSLPQTGQLNWPIPILVVAGLILFGLGWILCFGKRQKDET